MCVCVCESQGDMIPVGGGLRFRVQRLRERAFGNAGKPITALVEKTRLEYTALKADRTVSRGECLKLVTPPPVSSNRVQRNVKKVV